MSFRDSCCPQHAALNQCSLTCSVCHAPLRRHDAALVCARNHAFPIARDGYVNLLLKPRPGDTPPMLLARRQFLAAGYYQPLSDAINTLLVTQLSHQQSGKCILDAGCGEGYYLARLQRHLQATLQTSYCCYGVDTSKAAVRMAAKQHARICCFVADIKERIQVPDRSIDMLLNMFAPRNAQEFARVVPPGGVLLSVIPAPQHLHEVRQRLRLLRIEHGKQQRVVAQFEPAFVLAHAATLAYPLRLSGIAVKQLVAMTPNYWHAQDQGRLDQIEHIDTQAVFTMLLFQRK